MLVSPAPPLVSPAFSQAAAKRLGEHAVHIFMHTSHDAERVAKEFRMREEV